MGIVQLETKLWQKKKREQFLLKILMEFISMFWISSVNQ